MSKIQTLRKDIKEAERKLPYGSKQKIADAIGEPYGNIVSALRGNAGEDLTKRVLSEARKIIRKSQPKKRKTAAQAV